MRQFLSPFMCKIVMYISHNINSTQLYENAYDVFIKRILQKDFLNFLLTL